MSHRLDVTIESADGTRRDTQFVTERMYNLGSATRDPDTAVAHQQEVAKLGF